MRLAVVQCDVAYGDPYRNLKTLERKVDELVGKGVDLAVFPEAFLTGYCVGSQAEALHVAIPSVSDSLSPEVVQRGLSQPGVDVWQRIMSLVERSGISLVLGYISRSHEVVYNAATMWIPSREPVTYRKTHLPWLGVDRFVRPGASLPVFDTPWGKVGILICYDLRLPEPSRVLALEGAELIVLPTNWPRSQTADHYTIVRSSENKVFLAACNRIGIENGTAFVGRSGIYDPFGEVLAKAGDAEETLVTDLDLSLARNKRNVILPGEYELDLWGSRQPELYRAICDA